MTRHRSPFACLHPSNALTYVSLFAALGAIAAAARGSTAGAGALISAAAISDTFDGRFARAFRRDDELEAFGVQLDSLSDAIAFGVAPVTCTVLLAPPNGSAVVQMLWWVGALLFCASAITRLAYYNLSCGGRSGFIGMPVPVAALVWSSVLLTTPSPATMAGLLAACGAAMIAPIPIPRPAGTALAGFVLWPVALIAAHVARLLST